MRGSEVTLSLEEMKLWTPLFRRSDTMKITALNNGEISLGAALRRSMDKKMGGEWKVDIYATDDMKIMALQPNEEGKFRYPKNGRRVFRDYVFELKKKGYKIPATYEVEWNEQLQSWVGVLKEVAESPHLIKRGRKNGK